MAMLHQRAPQLPQLGKTPKWIHSNRSKAHRVRPRAVQPEVTIAAAAAAVTSAHDNVSQGQQQSAWDSFAGSVSGEWEGVTASFTPAGQPLTLPEHYVPEAFREWGVELWDWQSQCSCLAAPGAADSSSRGLKSVVRRLMPTVGCEADAIAFTEEDASSSSDGSSDGSGLCYTADGSYSSGPAVLAPVSKDGGPSKFQVEHCFALPQPGPSSSGGSNDGSSDGSSGSSSSGSRLRVKVVQQFRRNWGTGGWVLDAVDLHREKFDGPYTGKRELAGCGGGQPGISQLPALQDTQLAGEWAADAPARLSCVGSSGAAPEGTQLTLLPLSAWSAVQLSPEGQLQRAEAGVLLGQQQQQQQQQQAASADAQGPGSSGGGSQDRLVSCRVYDAGSGQLETASIAQESLRA